MLSEPAVSQSNAEPHILSTIYPRHPKRGPPPQESRNFRAMREFKQATQRRRAAIGTAGFTAQASISSSTGS
jgi:hypothetical protein